jgi:hypothetical protein
LRLLLNIYIIFLAFAEGRDLKASSSRGSTSRTTSTSRNTYTKSSGSYNKNYASNGVYTYSAYKNPTSYTNSYWNSGAGRTS